MSLLFDGEVVHESSRMVQVADVGHIDVVPAGRRRGGKCRRQCICLYDLSNDRSCFQLIVSDKVSEFWCGECEQALRLVWEDIERWKQANQFWRSFWYQQVQCEPQLKIEILDSEAMIGDERTMSHVDMQHDEDDATTLKYGDLTQNDVMDDVNDCHDDTCDDDSGANDQFIVPTQLEARREINNKKSVVKKNSPKAETIPTCSLCDRTFDTRSVIYHHDFRLHFY